MTIDLYVRNTVYNLILILKLKQKEIRIVIASGDENNKVKIEVVKKHFNNIKLNKIETPGGHRRLGYSSYDVIRASVTLVRRRRSDENQFGQTLRAVYLDSQHDVIGNVCQLVKGYHQNH